MPFRRLLQREKHRPEAERSARRGRRSALGFALAGLAGVAGGFALGWHLVDLAPADIYTAAGLYAGGGLVTAVVLAWLLGRRDGQNAGYR